MKFWHRASAAALAVLATAASALSHPGATASATTREPVAQAAPAVIKPVRPWVKASSGWNGAIGDGTGDGLADIWATMGPNRWKGDTSRNGITEFYINKSYSQQYLYGEPGAQKYRMNKSLATMKAMIPTVDWNGDRKADFLIHMDGQLWMYYNQGNGNLTKGIQVGRNWDSMDTIIFAGALNGDSRQYVLAREKATGNLFAYTMNAKGQLSGIGQVGRGWQKMRFILAPGNMVGDAKADLLGIDGAGNMFCYRGTGNGKITLHNQCGRGWDGFDHALVPGDMDGDGLLDLVSVRKLTDPVGNYNPRDGQGAPETRGPIYMYRNLGKAQWGKADLIGYDFYQFDVVA